MQIDLAFPEGGSINSGNAIMNLFSKLREWRLYSETVEKLRQCSDRNLEDMGIRRTDIPAVARRSVRAIR